MSNEKQIHLSERFRTLWGEEMEGRLPGSLSDFLEDGLTLDDAILIDQDGGRHPVSKPILAVNSKFFLALFSRSPDQQDTFPITIVKRSSSTAEGLALVLSSMVREEVEVNEENVMEVMQTAEYLQVESLSQYCQQVRSYGEHWGWTFLSLSLSGWLLSWMAPMPSASGSLLKISFWRSSTRRLGATLQQGQSRCLRAMSYSTCLPTTLPPSLPLTRSLARRSR